ncbi:MAG: tagaturonate reductase [Clostridia bacterium]|nr:tagaturonate reductase [Clostridia bacterium]
MKETVIQFGEGNFLRGFFDWFLDGLNKQGLYDGKAVIVQSRAGGKTAGLVEQDCKYNLYLRGIEMGEVKNEHYIIEAISRCVDPYKDFDAFLSLADNPDFRFVVSNTTEAGIAFDDNCKFDDKPCLSFPGKVTQLLYKRYENGLGGFVLLPCELIDSNGDELKKCVLQYADLWQLPEGFKDWIINENKFVNTLVDRIVTGYPDDDAATLHPDDKYLDAGEVFHLWVIEGDFENELPLKKGGYNVVWTSDVKPYKKIKVRILNGAHTSMVAGALLSGVETVGECMQNDLVSGFLNRAMYKEILPTIGENEESLSFAKAVFDRFSNPYIKHQLRSIALNSVSKFGVRVLPTLLEYKEKFGEYPPCLTMSLAYLIAFYKNDEPKDDESVIGKIKNNSIAEILSDASLWQRDLSGLTVLVEEYYAVIEKSGAKGAMEWILSK